MNGMPRDIHQQLVQIAEANPHLLTAYKNDLHVHDLESCRTMKKGTRSIWLLREHGTQMFPIDIGQDPLWLTYWLNGSQISIKTPPLAFLINAHAPNLGTVEPISLDKARELAEDHLPAQDRHKGRIAYKINGFKTWL